MYITVMNNIFYGTKSLDEIYDLKVSKRLRCKVY